MAKAKPAPEPEPEDEKYPFGSMNDAELAAAVAANPYAHLTHADIRRLFQFGQKFMRQLVGAHPPMAAGKINPRRFDAWLSANAELVRSLGSK